MTDLTMAAFYWERQLSNSEWQRSHERVSASRIFDNSHRGKQANEVGYLGEIIFEDFLRKHQIEFTDQREETTHDYIINQTISIDLKTKDRTVRPRGHFDNSVPLYNHDHQRPDYFFFISLLRDRYDSRIDICRFTHAFILGGIDMKTLETDGIQWKKGQIDPANGTEFWTDCLNVSMGQLIDNKKMLDIFRAKAQ